MLNITLQQIAAFLKVAEMQSFTKAAEVSFITQPALSRIVSRFEKSLNTKLFIRKSHNIELTENGMQLFIELQPLFSNLSNTLQKIGNDEKHKKKSLQIACHTSFDINNPENSFRSAIRRFREKNPDVSLTIQLYELTELRDSLLDGDVDLLYSVSTTFDNISALEYKIVEEIPVYIAMAVAHPLVSEPIISLNKLSDETFYFISSVSADRHFAICKQFGLFPNKIVLLPNYPSVIMAVRQGLGVTICGIDVKYSYGSDIAFREIPDLSDRPQMLLAWSPKNSSPELDEFIDMMQ